MGDEILKEEGTICKVADAIEIAQDHRRWWLRGHDVPLPHGIELLPRIFRAKLEQQFQNESICETRFPHTGTSWRSVKEDEKRFWYEPEIAANFSSQAPAVYANCVDEREHLSWMFLMQHFGAPTRILDWTTSVLVALYFAVAARGEESEEVEDLSDGEIWALDADELTEAWRQANYGKSLSEEARRLASEARTDARFRKPRSLHDNDCSTMPIAVWGPLSFSRLAVQHSRFTIHPRPLSGAKWPQRKRKIMKRFRVGGGSKRELRCELAQLGFTKFTLFQDLDSLGQTVVPEMLRHYSP